MKLLTQEFKLALASLLRLPSFSLTVITTLAVTLSALAVVLNINYLVLTKPLPYPEADKLIVTDQQETINGESQYGFQILSAQYYLYLDDTYIDEMTLMSVTGGRLKDTKDEPYIDALQVTPEYFSLLGVPMHMGRALNDKEGVNDKQKVAVLSFETWQSNFNADPNIIGTYTSIGNDKYQVVGVTAQDFSQPEVFGRFDIGAWLSFSYEISTTSHWDNITGGFNGIAKLKPGVSLEQANASLGEQINKLYLSQENVAPNTSIGARFMPIKNKIIGDSDEMAYVLLIGVITLLFIAVTNICNIFFSRAAEKKRTMAIQAAMGAQPRHLFLGMFAEAISLVVVAWLLGLVLAGWILVGLENDLQLIFPRMHQLTLDAVTMSVSGIISILVAFVMAKVSVKQVNYEHLVEDLHVSGKGTGAQISATTRNVLVATQVSLATILIIGATAILSPVYEKITKPLGFESESVDYIRVDSGGIEEGIFEYSLQLKNALKALPEIEDAARSYTIPLAMGWENYLYEADNNMLGIVSTGMMDSNMFSVMGHPLIEGRYFSEIESSDAIPQEMIISESLAKRLFKSESAIGKTLQTEQNSPSTVVGVVSDIYVPDQGFDYALERYYTPYPGNRLGFVLKLNTPVSKTQLLSVIRAVNPNFSLAYHRSIDEYVDDRLRQAKLTGVLTLSLVILALCLAAVGIYGVLSYSVQMRRYELGIHLSLGAHTGQLIKMVVKQSMVPVVIGIIVGVILATIAHLVGQQIWVYQLRTNMVTFALSLPVMALVAGLACYWPVKKVIYADPIKALRNE